MYKKSTYNISTFNGERIKSFLLRSGMKQGHLILFLCSHYTGNSSQLSKAKEQNKRQKVWKERGVIVFIHRQQD